MAVHLLIVDALNLIRRIHAVQGSPCVDTCLHALEQLIVHSQPTHAVAVFDDEDRAHGWRHQRLPEYKAGRAPMPGDAGRRDAGAAGRLRTAGDPLLGLAGQRSGRSRRHPGGEGGPGGPSGHHRLHRQRLLPAAVAHHPHSATTFRSAGWTPPSSPASSASPRSSWRITGG
ncbi:DNA polymerase I [Klebsiella pneumoniae]|uniref:DNA polymerase I n=1 Tax=Klebsiella pneumoniae TaxID=573 RepID=A0A4P0YEK0_KLEPN|nr:DNA polymerase I [Klebsiella pneumoniae]